MLRSERERVAQKDRSIEELVRHKELMQTEHEGHLCERKAEFDNLKRAFDELHYESENLRRTINSKSDEIQSLTRLVNQQGLTNDQLTESVRRLEETIKDVEEKNKRLVDLLNANIYSKAEQYKEKVMNKLLDRTNLTQPPAICSPINFNHSVQITTQPLRKSGENEQSPIRLQRIVCEDQEQKVRERERYLKLAEKITNRQVFGQPTQEMPHHQMSEEHSQERSKSPFTNL